MQIEGKYAYSHNKQKCQIRTIKHTFCMQTWRWVLKVLEQLTTSLIDIGSFGKCCQEVKTTPEVFDSV